MKILTFLFILFYFSFSQQIQGGWVKTFNRDSIEVKQAKVGTNVLIAFMGTTVISNTSDNIVKVLYDTDNWNRWLHGNLGTKFLSNVSKSEKYYYSATKSPVFFIADRDYVASVRIGSSESQETVVEVFSLTPEQIQSIDSLIPTYPNRVRMPFVWIQWILQQLTSNTTKVSFIVFADPGGLVPKWVVNMASQEIPYESLVSLRKMMEMFK